MKIRSAAALAFKNLARYKKHNIAVLILMIISEAIMIFTLCMSSSLKSYMYSAVINSVDGRIIYVAATSLDIDMPEKDLIKAVGRQKHIVTAQPQSSQSIGGICKSLAGMINNSDGEIGLSGANENTTPPVIYGRNIKSGERHAGIIPVDFYPDSSAGAGKTYGKTLDGRKFIGKNITVNYKYFTYTFKVVGVYNSSDCEESQADCFIPYDDVSLIGKESRAHDKIKASEGIPPIIAVVDSYDNVGGVIKSLTAQGYNADRKIETNNSLGFFINAVGITLSLIVGIIAFISIILFTLNSVKNREKELGLMKALGYTGGGVMLILNMETLLTGLISFVFASFAGACAVLSVKYFGKASNDIPINLYLTSYIAALAISVLTPLLGTLAAGIRSLRVSPVCAMKE